MMTRLLRWLAVTAGAVVLGAGIAHADGTIDTLSAGSPLGGTEQIPMFQSSNPAVKTTPNAIQTFLTGTSGAHFGLLNGNLTLSGNNTYSGTANFTSTFSISSTAETFPASGLLVGTTDTQTLSGKTLTSPTINAGALSGTFTGTPTLSGNLTFSGNPTFSGVPILSGLSAGTQVSCLGLDSGNHIVLEASSCGTGSGGTPGGSNTQVQFNSSSSFGGSANLTWVSPTLTIGASGTTGQLALIGSGSGTATITPQATAGTPTLTLPNASGTFAVSASAPMALSATTGNLTITGVAGEVLAGATPAFTATPVLGVPTSLKGTLGFAGNTSGTVTVQPAAAAGTWSWTWPTSGGSNGQFLQTDGTGITSWGSPAGSGTVNSGTAGQLGYYATSTNVISGNVNLTASAGALTLGQAGAVVGNLILSGDGSGAVTIQPQSAAGTYNFNLPIIAGASGRVLTSAGGGSSPMTWTALATIATSGAITDATGTLLVGHGGTGATTLTIHGVLLGETTGAIVATAAGASGNLLIGQGAADPTWNAMSGDVTISSAGATTIGSNKVVLGDIAQSGANTMLGNWTGSTANVLANSMPSCADTGSNHLSYVSGTGITCGTAVPTVPLTSLAAQADQTVVGNGSGGSAVPVALVLDTGLIATATKLQLTVVNAPLTTSTTISSSNFNKAYTLGAGTSNLVVNSGVLGNGQTVAFQVVGGTWTRTGTETINGLNSTALLVGTGGTLVGNGSNTDFYAGCQAPGTASIGCLFALSGATSNQWVAYVGTDGVQHTTQPAFSNLSGSATAAQMLALATGDVYQGNGSNQAAAVTMSAAIDAAIGSTEGDILYRGASAWNVLAPGTSGQFLKTLGPAAIPAWASVSATGCSPAGSIHDIVTDDGAGGCTSDTNATLNAGAMTLGASGTLGSIVIGNATSGTVTLNTVTGALGSVTASLPANTGTIAEINLVQTWTAAQSTIPVATSQSGAGNLQSLAARFSQVYNVKDFYASGSQTTTTTTTASGTSVTLAGAIDFTNGEGILVNHAGPAFPAQVTITGTSTNGSATITSASTCTGVLVGATVVSDNIADIPPGNIVVSCSAGNLVMSQPAGIALTANAGASAGSSHTFYVGIAAPATPVAAAGTSSSGSTSYEYKIAAVDANGGVKTAGTASNNLASRESVASLVSSGHSVLVTWTTPAHGAYFGVCIWRSTDSGSTWTGLGSVSGRPGTGLGAATTYSDNGSADNSSAYCPAAPPGADVADQYIGTIVSGATSTSLVVTPALTQTISSSVTVAHDDNAAILAALNASMVANPNLSAISNAAVYIPPGTYNVCTALPMTGPASVFADSPTSALLNIRPGCAAPVVVVECSNGGTVYASGQFCTQNVFGFQIASPSRDDGPGNANAYASNFTGQDNYAAHGILAITNVSNPTTHTALRIGRMIMNATPGDCLYGNNWAGGFIIGDGTNQCEYPGAHGIFGSSVADWWTGFLDAGGALLHNYSFSCGQSIHLTGSTEVAAKDNIHIYGTTACFSEIQIQGMYIDIAGNNGLGIDGSGAGSTFISVGGGTTFRYNGFNQTSGSDSDIGATAAARGQLQLGNVHFKKAGGSCGNPFSAPFNTCPQYNIDFTATTTMTAQVSVDTAFDLGDVGTLNVTNNQALVRTFNPTIQITTQSSTPYTLAESDCGTKILFTDASAVTVTIPATLNAGCQVSIEQNGAGAVSVNGSAVTPATLHSAHSYTKTSGQYAVIGITIDTNSGGSSAVAILTGDGA